MKHRNIEKKSFRPSGVKLGKVCGLVFLSTLFLATQGGVIPRAEAKKKSKATAGQRIAYLEAARRALVERDVARAVTVLALARKCWKKYQEGCGFFRVDYEALVGVVYMEHGQYRKAAESFRQVLLKQPHRKAMWLYYGQALYELKLYGRSAGALKKAQGVRDDSVVYWVLRARAEVRSGALRRARNTLEQGLKALPEAAELYGELAFLFSRVGLMCAAGKMAYHYAVITDGDLMAYYHVAERLVADGRARIASRVLEEARMIDPMNPEVLQRLAHAYMHAGRPLTAGQIYEIASYLNPKRSSALSYAASEAFRSCKHYRDALRSNWRVTDEVKRLRQRLNIFLGRRAYGRALQLRRPLIRADAMSSEVRYRLAYAGVCLGRYGVASSLLQKVRGKGYGPMAKRLLELMEPCEEKPWLCP